jgi:outer membrane protein assembly factor BamB
MKKNLLLVFLPLFLTAQTTRIVPTQYATIQSAIDTSANGDTVLVLPGVYKENIDDKYKSITITSNYLINQDTSYIGSTIIDGNRSGSVVTVHGQITFIGLTIMNGYSEYGAGFRVYYGSNVVLSNLVIKNNESYFGSAINSDGIFSIDRSRIINNKGTSNYIWCNNGPNQNYITNCLLYGNLGALWVANSTELNIVNSTVLGNSGINMSSGCKISILNSIVLDNISNSFSTLSAEYSLLIPSINGVGNISTNIIFQDTANGNFTLSDYSPTIGAGTAVGAPLFDINGNPRPGPSGSNPDIGAYESPRAHPKLVTPLLYSPNADTINQPISLLFKWFSIYGAQQYHFQLASDSNFTSAIVIDTLLADTLKSVCALAFANTYYWRVSAINQWDTSAYSTVLPFTTIIEAPSIPINLLPSNGSTAQPLTPTLNWSIAPRASTYRLQVATDSSFSNLVVNDSTLAANSNQVGPLANNTIYYWRVNAKNVGGASQYSASWMFVTILATPALVSPTNLSGNVSAQPILNWSTVSGATHYQLQLSPDSLFVTLVLNDSTLTTNTSQIGQLGYSSTYFWRVRAKNVLSNSAYSSVFSFTTIIQAPAVPVLASPANGSIGNPTSLTLQWNTGQRAEKYHLQLTIDTTTNSFTVDDSAITATTKGVSTLLQSTKYFWRVRSINVGGTSGFSTYWSFFTNLDGPTIVTAAAGYHKVTISWMPSALPNIALYRIYRGTASPASVLRDSVFSSQTAYSDSGLVNGTMYFYRVTAVNNYGIESAFSNEANATPFNSPPVAVKLQNINENNAGRVLKKMYSYSSIGSHDADGRIDSVQWYVNDTYFSKADSLIYDYAQGTTKVMLRVFDSDMASDSSIANVNRTLFMTDVNGPVYGGVTLLGDSTLYAVASGNAVYRLDNSGNIVYPLQVGGEIRSASSISNDHVVYIASSDKNLYAFGSSGTAIWPARPQGAVVSASVTIDTIANRLYVGIQNSNFVAVNRADGTNVWNFFSDAPIAQSAVINADRTLIFSTTKGTIYGIDLANLPSPVAPTWTLSIGDTITTSPAIDIQRAYYVGTSGGALIKFVKVQNQQPNIVWQFPTKGRIEASPIIDAAGIVYVGSTDSSLYAINSVTGDLKWAYRTNGKIKTTGAVTNQRVVYVGNESGELIALDSLGNRIWYYRADSSISSAIVANKGSLYFGTYGKKVIGIFDGGSQTQQLGKTAVLSEPQWGTFQGNNQRTGVQSSTLLYVQNQEKAPVSFALSQNFPNPFNPSTTLQYGVPVTSRVRLQIYNVLGQVVADLVDGEQSAGWHRVQWNADVSTGIYFYRIDAVSVGDPNNRFVQVKKMLLLR